MCFHYHPSIILIFCEKIDKSISDIRDMTQKNSFMSLSLSHTKCKHSNCLKFIHLSTIPETHTPQRKGLRSSALRPKKPEPAKQTGPVVIETWVAEEELDLWEIRAFSERSGSCRSEGCDICTSKVIMKHVRTCLEHFRSG